VPLVTEAFDWNHGVFMGSTISSERTAAAEGTVGELRRDPFAMMPFCGYNMADYFGHWVEVGELAEKLPRVYQVNWFRKGDDGRFLWPGFAENSRVIEWIIRRIEGSADATDTPIGRVPVELNVEGLDLPDEDLAALFEIDLDGWLDETRL